MFELSTGIKPTSLIMRLENSQSKFELQAKQLKTLLGYYIDLRKQTLGSLFSRIESLSLKREILHEQKNLKDLSLRIRKAYEMSLTNLETKLQAIDRLRETLGYRETLNRGYAVIRSGDDVITEKAKALYETNLSIEFWDGELPIKNLND